VPAPPAELQTRNLHSAALGCNITYAAYRPTAASPPPALFLLHGADGSHSDFTQHAHNQLLQLSATHHIALVLPEGSREGWWLNSYATHLLDEVIPDTTNWLQTNTRHSIAGISAGGNAAIVSALTHPGKFTSVSSLSGALDLAIASNRAALVRALGAYDESPTTWQRWSARHLLPTHVETARQLPLLLTVGSNDLWAETNRRVSAELQALAIEHTFRESPGGHDWNHWVAQLPEHITFHAHHLHATP
jgi:S-formylglutathione hydrolase FrmB